MKRKLLLLIFFIAIIVSYHCNNTPDGSDQNASNDQPALKISRIYLLDSIEHFFGNENWQMIDGTDTSYLLFSRQNDAYIKVYHYKMKGGDSVNNIVSEISFRGDSVAWTYPGQRLILQKAIDKETDWTGDNSKDTTPVSFRQIEKDKIVFQQASKKIYMVKTITLSDFLVRSRYDYSHGTHFAFDTVTFNRYKSKKNQYRPEIKNEN